MKNKKIITHVKIPGEVAFNPDLNSTDMFVYWLIKSLDSDTHHCYARNSFLATKLNVSERTIIYSISKLKKLGYIKFITFDGRRRTISADPKYLEPFKKHVADYNERGVQSQNTSEMQEGSGLDRNLTTYIDNDNIISKDDNCKSINAFTEENSQIFRHGSAVHLNSKSDLEGKKKPVSVPDPYHTILDFYYDITSVTKPGPTTKTLKKDVDTLRKLRNGKLFDNYPVLSEFNRKYSYGELKEIIKRHSLALNPEYELENKKYYKIHFHKFLYNPFADTKSYFCKWLKDPPTHKGYIQKNPYPEMTDVFLKHLSRGKPIKPKEMNKLIRAAKLTVQFFKDHPETLKSRFQSKSAMAEILWEAVKADDTIKGYITAGYLCSDTTFDRRLPDYCERQLLFEEPEYISPLEYSCGM